MNDLQPAIDCLKVRLFQINSAIQILEGLEEFREEHRVNPPAAGAHPHIQGQVMPAPGYPVRPRCKGTCGDVECEEMEAAYQKSVVNPGVRTVSNLGSGGVMSIGPKATDSEELELLERRTGAKYGTPIAPGEAG